MPVAVLNALAAALARPVAKLAAATAVQVAADRQAAARVAAPAALDAEHVAAVPALQAAAGPVDAAAQTHKAVGTGVAATDEQPHAPWALAGGMIHAVNTNLTNAPHHLRHPRHKNRRHVLTSFVLMADRGT